jgi:catechol 2,3-dioxygenase-like lactoylglutathione lyase family enzyme
VNVVFITSVAVVAADPPQSRRLFREVLGLPLEGEGDGYYSSGSIPGSKHFGVWPLSQAAEACFGTPEWPASRVVPQASIEFEVEDAEAVAAAGGELERAGFELLHPARTEPRGQTVTRLLTADGLIVGISYAPRFTAKNVPEHRGHSRNSTTTKIKQALRPLTGTSAIHGPRRLSAVMPPLSVDRSASPPAVVFCADWTQTLTPVGHEYVV